MESVSADINSMTDPFTLFEAPTANGSITAGTSLFLSSPRSGFARFVDDTFADNSDKEYTLANGRNEAGNWHEDFITRKSHDKGWSHTPCEAFTSVDNEMGRDLFVQLLSNTSSGIDERRSPQATIVPQNSPIADEEPVISEDAVKESATSENTIELPTFGKDAVDELIVSDHVVNNTADSIPTELANFSPRIASFDTEFISDSDWENAKIQAGVQNEPIFDDVDFFAQFLEAGNASAAQELVESISRGRTQDTTTSSNDEQDKQAQPQSDAVKANLAPGSSLGQDVVSSPHQFIPPVALQQPQAMPFHNFDMQSYLHQDAPHENSMQQNLSFPPFPNVDMFDSSFNNPFAPEVAPTLVDPYLTEIAVPISHTNPAELAPGTPVLRRTITFTPGRRRSQSAPPGHALHHGAEGTPLRRVLGGHGGSVGISASRKTTARSTPTMGTASPRQIQRHTRTRALKRHNTTDAESGGRFMSEEVVSSSFAISPRSKPALHKDGNNTSSASSRPSFHTSVYPQDIYHASQPNSPMTRVGIPVDRDATMIGTFQPHSVPLGGSEPPRKYARIEKAMHTPTRSVPTVGSQSTMVTDGNVACLCHNVLTGAHILEAMKNDPSLLDRSVQMKE